MDNEMVSIMLREVGLFDPDRFLVWQGICFVPIKPLNSINS